MSCVQTFIVEDSPLIRDNLAATLEELAPVKVVGWSADEAGARRWLDAGRADCDLVIIDIFLQSGSGLGVLQHLAASRHPSKRVVLTNYSTPDMRRRCESLGANRVFDKSNEVDELVAYCTRLATGDSDQASGAPQ